MPSHTTGTRACLEVPALPLRGLFYAQPTAGIRDGQAIEWAIVFGRAIVYGAEAVRFGLPVPAFNLLLGLIYLSRYLSYLGAPIGLPLHALHVSYSIVQSVCSFFLYVFFPVFNSLPVLLLPARERRKRMRRVNLFPAAACGLYVASVLAVYPYGWEVASSRRSPVPEAETPRRPDFRAGVVLRVPAGSRLTDAHLEAEDTHLRHLGVRAVNLFVHEDLMTDERKAATLGRFLDRLRKGP